MSLNILKWLIIKMLIGFFVSLVNYLEKTITNVRGKKKRIAELYRVLWGI